MRRIAKQMSASVPVKTAVTAASTLSQLLPSCHSCQPERKK